MRRTSKTLTLVALVSLLGLLSARAEPRPAFRLEGRVPASTLAFASLEQLDGWQQRLEATAIGKLMSDPEMQAFFAPLGEAVEQLVAGGGIEVPPLVMDLFGQLRGLRGQAAIALVDVDVERDWPLAALSLDFGDQVDDFVGFLERLRAELDPSGGNVKTVEKDGRTWWRAKAGGKIIHATAVDTAFVVATDEGLLQTILGGTVAGSLAEDEDFRTVKARAGGDDLGIFVYANVDAALASFGHLIGARERRIASALGLDTVKSVAYGTSFRGDGFRETLLIHAPDADHGLVPTLDMKPLTAPRTLDLAPAGAFVWTEGTLPLDDLIPRVRTLVASIDPDATESIDAGLDQVGQMIGVDMEKEFLAGLEGTFGAYAALPATGGLYPEVAVVLVVKDPASFEGVFDRLTQGIAGLVSEEGRIVATTRSLPYHGTTMHLFEMQKARGDDVVPFTPTWALIGDRLVVTLVPYAMKEIILRAQGVTGTPGLATKEDFQSLMALKPVHAGAMAYVDLKGLLSVLYDTGVPLLQTIAKPNVLGDFPLPLDWALLPPASRVVPHLRSLAKYVTWNKDGIEVSVQGPVPMMVAVAGVAAMTGLFVSGSMHTAVRPGPAWVDEEVDIDAEMDRELAEIQAEMLVDRIEFCRAQKDRLAQNLSELIDLGFLNVIPKDPWGGAFRLRIVGDGEFVVESAGPDRRYGTPDDVRLPK